MPLTAEDRSAFLDLLRTGAAQTRFRAARMAGIDHVEMNETIRRGIKGADPEAVEFYRRVQEAEAERGSDVEALIDPPLSSLRWRALL